MRPIDADALAVQIRDYVFHDFTDEFWGVMYCIGEAPTIERRKAGNWNTIQGNIVVCSVCGMGAPQTMTGSLVNRHLEPNRTNFCPNCGADMRMKEE